MAAVRTQVKRGIVHAASRAGMLDRLLELARRARIARMRLVTKSLTDVPRAAHGPHADGLDPQARPSGLYLARRDHAADHIQFTTDALLAGLATLEGLGVASVLVFEESTPVLLVDRDDWSELRRAPRSGSTPWELHRRTRTPRAADHPLRILDETWLDDADGQVELFVPRRGESDESLGGQHHTVRVKAALQRDMVSAFTLSPGQSRSGLIAQQLSPPFPIDAVYTWVDGTDPEWRDRKARATGATTRDTYDGDAAHRFASRDELRYSLRSIDMYAPWIRNIYIVTDLQHPTWLADHERVRIIDHTELIPARFLPTFNSHVIESALHLIDGLAENYLYFNDDMLFGAPTNWSDFFSRDGSTRFFLSAAKIPPPWQRPKTIDFANFNARRLMRERFGVEITNKMRHTPYAQRKSVHEWMSVEFSEEVERTRSATLRSETDQSFAAYLHHFVGRELGLSSAGRIKSDYFDLADPGLSRRLRAQRERLDPAKALCLNDAEVGDQFRTDRAVLDFFTKAYPFASAWEKC